MYYKEDIGYLQITPMMYCTNSTVNIRFFQILIDAVNARIFYEDK